MWRGGESPVRSGARSRPVKRPSRARPPPSRLPQAAVLTTTTDFEVTPIRPTIAIQDHLSESRLRSIRPTRAGAATTFLVYRYSNGGECGFQFFALPFQHEMSRLGIPADVARQVFHPRRSEKVQIKPENFIGHGD